MDNDEALVTREENKRVEHVYFPWLKRNQQFFRA